MITLYPSQSRGIAEHGWLHSRFSFSFAEYYNPNRIHFGALRVLNDDIVEPGMGFGMHPHDNMEIITIPLSGSLKHNDSMGNGSIINAGDVQVMSAGTGILHSEFNPSKTEPVSLFQIWIFPKIKNVTPRYDQQTIDFSKFENRFRLIVGPMGANGVLNIHQDAWLSMGNFSQPTSAGYTLNKSGNGLFIININGTVRVEDKLLNPRDAVEITGLALVNIEARADTRALIIEVPL